MTENNILIFFIIVALNIVLTRILLRNFNYYLMDKGIFGLDINKVHKPKIPEEGGVSITISFLFSLTLFGFYFSNKSFVAVGITTLLISLLGFIDHFKNIRPYPKFIYTAIIGSVYSIYFLQHNSFNLLLSITLIVGIAILYSVLVNAYNLLAGFNGLESGLTVISSAALSTYLYIYGHEAESAVCFLLMSGYTVFWMLNKYPASIFIGDSGTLVPPSVYLGVGLITGHITPVIIVLLPHLVNALIKYASTGVKSRSDLKPLLLKDGLLHMPENGYQSLIRLFLISGPKHEKMIVSYVYAVEAVCCLLIFFIPFPY